MTRLTKQREKLETLLTGINPFNAKSRAEEICKLLDTYIPSVEAMDTQLRKYNVAFTDTVRENRKLKKTNVQLNQSLTDATKQSTLKQLEDAKLRREYEAAVSLLDRIPQEVLDVYAHEPNGRKEKANDR